MTGAAPWPLVLQAQMGLWPLSAEGMELCRPRTIGHQCAQSVDGLDRGSSIFEATDSV